MRRDRPLRRAAVRVAAEPVHLVDQVGLDIPEADPDAAAARRRPAALRDLEVGHRIGEAALRDQDVRREGRAHAECLQPRAGAGREDRVDLPDPARILAREPQRQLGVDRRGALGRSGARVRQPGFGAQDEPRIVRHQRAAGIRPRLRRTRQENEKRHQPTDLPHHRLLSSEKSRRPRGPRAPSLPVARAGIRIGQIALPNRTNDPTPAGPARSGRYRPRPPGSAAGRLRSISALP